MTSSAPQVTCDLTSPSGLRRAARWATGNRATFVPWGPAEPTRTDVRYRHAGVELWNARAVAMLTRGPWAWLVRRSWLAAELAELMWAFMAWLAPVLGFFSAALRGPTLADAGMARTRSLSLRIIGLATIAAAVSWWMQVDGLVGSGGIVPVGEWLEAARHYAETHELGTFEVAPTWLWLDASDAALHATCALAVLGGALMLLGVLPGLGAVLGFAAYLSLVATGNVFMGYQWDALLLEALVVSALLAPWTRWTLWRGLEPNRVAVLLARLVAFKLYFMSGLVKLASADPVWGDLTALDYHWWTQPLPLASSWLMLELPPWVSTALCAFTLFAELVLPWALLLPQAFRRVRIGATLAMIALQVGIAATGNFGFFNLLSIGVLSIGLDDRFLRPRWLGRGRDFAPVVARRWSLRAAPVGVMAALLAALTAFEVRMVWQREAHPQPVAAIAEAVAPYRISNTYGLFANMTLERPEVEIEGSYDGQEWHAYRFRWKPDGEFGPPTWTGLHMPRLDWQLWFTALAGDCFGRDVGWYGHFLERLLQNAPAVTALLAGNPFQGPPPKYVRSVVREYAPVFGTDGHWWQRDAPRRFCPDVMLRDGRLYRANLIGDAPES